jgi:hypothetical protein
MVKILRDKKTLGRIIDYFEDRLQYSDMLIDKKYVNMITEYKSYLESLEGELWSADRSTKGVF